MSLNYFNEKMVFVSMSDTAGGAENVLLTIAKTTRGPMIFLKKESKAKLMIPENQDVSYVAKTSLLLGFILLFRKLAKYRKGYVIMSTHPYLNAYLGVLKGIGFLQSHLIVRECTSVFTRFKGIKRLSYQLVYRLGYPFVNLIICQTAAMREQLLEHNNFIPDHKAIVIDNPVDLELMREKARQEIQDKDLEDEFICTAGRLIPLKGFSILIQAFSKICTKHTNLKLLILGEGKERDNLNMLIQQLGLKNRVILKGHVSNPSPYFSKAKLCVVSSIQEGFPNVLLEMMAVNENVVSTLCAGGIENMSSIIKAKVDDVPALSSALEQGLAKQQGQRLKRRPFESLGNRKPQFFVESIYKEVNKAHLQKAY